MRRRTKVLVWLTALVTAVVFVAAIGLLQGGVLMVLDFRLQAARGIYLKTHGLFQGESLYLQGATYVHKRWSWTSRSQNQGRFSIAQGRVLLRQEGAPTAVFVIEPCNEVDLGRFQLVQIASDHPGAPLYGPENP